MGLVHLFGANHKQGDAKLVVASSKLPSPQVTTTRPSTTTTTSYLNHHPQLARRIDLELRPILHKMLARSTMRSTRAIGAVRNGAINTSKVRIDLAFLSRRSNGGLEGLEGMGQLMDGSIGYKKING